MQISNIRHERCVHYGIWYILISYTVDPSLIGCGVARVSSFHDRGLKYIVLDAYCLLDLGTFYWSCVQGQYIASGDLCHDRPFLRGFPRFIRL